MVIEQRLQSVGGLPHSAVVQEPYKQQLEPMLLQYVMPAFESECGHLRAKACWVAGQYADIDFRDGSGCGPTFNALFAQTVKALQDPDLPVSRHPCRVPKQAAGKGWLRACVCGGGASVRWHGQRLWLQVRVDAVVALRNLVEAYDEDHLADIKPHIAGLLDHLFRLMAEVSPAVSLRPRSSCSLGYHRQCLYVWDTISQSYWF